jgi:hypothetical protein
MSRQFCLLRITFLLSGHHNHHLSWAQVRSDPLQYNWILNFIFRCLTDPLERFVLIAQYTVVPERERKMILYNRIHHQTVQTIVSSGDHYLPKSGSCLHIKQAQLTLLFPFKNCPALQDWTAYSASKLRSSGMLSSHPDMTIIASVKRKSGTILR